MLNKDAAVTPQMRNDEDQDKESSDENGET